ncbi:hypothetical protein K431DRAFT_108406 [Polychaeton citri CBS 116435]|uniref:Myb-like domain-containing protein n=1 Tax=Polychaeton citri CBS 116435 TaxID=1314669 RepID=A0A9P4UN92_9PEZI|nr:hypothetical protein K431DRAFT_108406 [Polychaeton citri CBS 116435]
MPAIQQISSAVAGKQSAPKAPPRRRAAPSQKASQASPAATTPSTQATPAAEPVPPREPTPPPSVQPQPSVETAQQPRQKSPPAQAARTVTFAEPPVAPPSPPPTQHSSQAPVEPIPESESQAPTRSQTAHAPSHEAEANAPIATAASPARTQQDRPVQAHSVSTAEDAHITTGSQSSKQRDGFSAVNNDQQQPTLHSANADSPPGEAERLLNAFGKRQQHDQDEETAQRPKRARREPTSEWPSGQTGARRTPNETTPATETSTRTPRKRQPASKEKTITPQTAPRDRRRRKQQARSAATVVSDDDDEVGRDKDQGSAENGEQAAGSGSEEEAAAARLDSEGPDFSNQKKAKKRQRKRKGPPVDENGEEVVDPESYQINAEKVMMFDLGFDSRLGRASEREQNMSKADWAKAKRDRHEAANRIFNGGKQAIDDIQGEREKAEKQGDDRTPNEGEEGEQTEEQGGNQGQEERPEEEEAEPSEPVGGGLGFRINANGEIVEDETTLNIGGVGSNDNDIINEEVEDEEDLTRRVNRNTFVNDRRRDPCERVEPWRLRSSAWTEEATDEFYRQLSLLGTDFEAIARTFPGKTRHMIKMKFTREEKLDADRITRALLGRNLRPAVTLESYAEATGMSLEFFNKYEGLDHAMQVISMDMKEKEEQMQAAVREGQEQQRQRAVQAGKREKALEAKEARKKQREARRHARRRGVQMGAGAMA